MSNFEAPWKTKHPVGPEQEAGEHPPHAAQPPGNRGSLITPGHGIVPGFRDEGAARCTLPQPQHLLTAATADICSVLGLKLTAAHPEVRNGGKIIIIIIN